MICQMTKNIFFVDKSTYHKWGDNVLKVCPSIKWSLNSLSLALFNPLTHSLLDILRLSLLSKANPFILSLS